MILIGHSLEQVHAGLMLQRNVPFQVRQNLFLQFAHSTLAVEQVADKEQRQRAKTEKGHAQCPFVSNRVEEHQRIHEHGQAGRLYQNKGCGQNRELQLTAFEKLQFFAVQLTHDVFRGLEDGRPV